MTRAASIAALAALAAILPPARAESWRGRFVSVPASLEGRSPAAFPKAASAGRPGLLPVSAGTYLAVCSLGDMAMERRYVPSEGGAASAPSGPLVSCMDASGEPTFSGAAHAQLYEFVYGEVARAPDALDIGFGATAFPLCMAALHDVYGVKSLKAALEPDADGRCGYLWASSMPIPAGRAIEALNPSAYAAGNPAARALKAALDAYGLRSSAAWNDDGINYGFAMALYYDVGVMPSDGGVHGHWYGNGSSADAFSQTASGSPLWAVDPLEAGYALDALCASPVLVPAAAAWTATNCVRFVATATNALYVSHEAIRAAADALVRAGGGSALLDSAQASLQAGSRSEAGAALRASRTVRYVQDAASPSVAAVWRCEDAEGGVVWETVSVVETESPKGTVTTRRRKATVATTATLARVDVGGVPDGLMDVKVTEVAAPLGTSAPARAFGWPHPSSIEWVGNDGRAALEGFGDVWAVAFGRRTTVATSADGAVSRGTNGVVRAVAYAWDGADGDRSLQGVLRAAWRAYAEGCRDGVAAGPPAAGFGDAPATLHVSAPTGAGGMSVSQCYQVTFEPAEGEDEPGRTVYYAPSDPGSSWPWPSGGVPGDLFGGDGAAPEGFSPSSSPPAPGDPYYVEESLSAWVERGEPTRGGAPYTETAVADCAPPGVFALVFWNFTRCFGF